jgi:hypothetical protein
MIIIFGRARIGRVFHPLIELGGALFPRGGVVRQRGDVVDFVWVLF